MTENAQIRSALRGQKLVVVGGDRREGAIRRLLNAFDLSDIIHCHTRKNDASPKCFESSLRDPGVLLVVWALGLSRTHHGEHLHRLCREFGIPWVDCFHIPHPNALVAQIDDLRLLESLLRRRNRVLDSSLSHLRRIGGAA